MRRSRSALRWLRVVQSARVSTCSRVELVAGVADVAAYGGVGPLARRRSRGSAGAARPAWRPRRSASLENRSACIRLRVSLAPTTSWWWKVTVPSSCEAPGARLADVVHQRGEAGDEVRAAAGQPVLEVDRLLEHGQGVLVDVLVPVVLVALQRQRRQLGQHVRRRARSRRAASARARGYGAQHQLDQLVADPLGRDDRRSARPSSVIAATTSGSTVKPSWAANRAARIIRSGSSEKESSGVPGRAQHPVREVDHAAVRVDELAARQRAPPSR